LENYFIGCYGKRKNSQPIIPWNQVERELIAAQEARDCGNEGKARVCARRAVSQALFLSGISSSRGLEAIQFLVEDVLIPIEIRNIGKSFLEKVDENHQLKSGIDLIENARKVITFIQDRKM
jgi:hypothetical protein